jgi:6-pyruvoyltetrahydropterin/6-carboxytetrahydropterin synthase
MSEHYILHVITTFNAARTLRDYQGPCANIHGHNFKVQADVKTPPPDEKGMVIDFYEIKALLERITKSWDHQFLNEISPFDVLNPTNENLAKFCFDTLTKNLNHPIARVQSITVWENEEAGVTYHV